MTGDNKYWTMHNDKFIEVPPIKELCGMLEKKFLDQDADNARLEKENQELKNGVFEKESIKQLKEDNVRMQTEMRYGFPITEEEHNKINTWINTHEKKYTGTIGGRYEYRFFPTGVGTIGKVIDTITGDEFTFSELD